MVGLGRVGFLPRCLFVCRNPVATVAGLDNLALD